MASVAQLVSLQVVSPGKSLTARITNKGFMIRMNQHVSLQVTSLRKSLTAHITKKGFVPSVDHLVSLQLTSLSKSLAAHITSKGFAAMPVHTTGFSEGLGVHITHMLAIFVGIHFMILITAG